MQKLLITLFWLLAMKAVAAQYQDLYEKREFVRGNDTLRYRLLYPVNYEAGKKYPLVLFLHGSGERGHDNEAQLIHGGKLFADSANRQRFPAFYLLPQCAENDFWARMSRDPNKKDTLGSFTFLSSEPMSKSMQLVSLLLDSMAGSGQVDAKRIYVGGLSMGGMGTFEILWRKPHFFAAAFPICGGGDPQQVKLYAKKFPIWVFHGSADQSVPVSNSRLMVNTLEAADAKVKYNEYPGVGHNSWDNAFAEPDLLSWLFKQKK
jgi:predicted peptidase